MNQCYVGVKHKNLETEGLLWHQGSKIAPITNMPVPLLQIVSFTFGAAREQQVGEQHITLTDINGNCFHESRLNIRHVT